MAEAVKNIEVIVADYNNDDHAKAIVSTLNQYALDPFGGSEPISADVLEVLVGEMSKVPGAFTLLAYIDGNVGGLLNCFQGFSTFVAKPLINIHDCAVLNEYRRLGICSKMLQKCEDIAKERGCVSVTLEVLAKNEPAKGAYLKHGFIPYELNPTMGEASFWIKKLAYDKKQKA
mmetsp:Transcript_47443/g.60930  ORF Transcript_47443/g.60930 Transcript_47443/m.60930 type:complete len:174 (+) Transcript_47443:33-554(+)